MCEFEQAVDGLPASRDVRRLVLVLGDQLDPRAGVFDGFDRERDAVLMVEVKNEAEHVPSHRQRTTLFLSAMRHFALDLIERGMMLRYVRLSDTDNTHAIGSEVERAIDALSPERLCVTQPGEHRVQDELQAACDAAGVHLDIRPDLSFTCSLDEFDAWAEHRSALVMEYFYRDRRRKLGVLVDGKKPVGGQWNFDKENRKAFDRDPEVARPYRPRPDGITRRVIDLVKRELPRAPGRIDHFRWPVTHREARQALHDFIEKRLPNFGTYEDAMWAGEPVLYHSRLSAPLNLKLLAPRDCIDAAVEALESGHAEINAVEGFVRQVMGWREFVRGIYYREGPGYAQRNGLGHEGKLAGLFWTGDTDMACLRHCVTEVLENAWGHHIPRLMVIGNIALMAGIDPRAVHAWFLGMYVDGVEWATAPNVIGMSQHADGGVVGTKPYAASGRYIQRMSNYCDGCRFDPSKRTGESACPFNVFYWDFLMRHNARFHRNPRMRVVLKHVTRMDPAERRGIRRHADRIRTELERDSRG